MREIGREKRRISGQFLALLRQKRFKVKALCLHTGVREIRRVLRSYRLPSSKIENILKSALSKNVLPLLYEVDKVFADREFWELFRRLGIGCQDGIISDLADIVAWSNLRRTEELKTRFLNSIEEQDVKEELMRLSIKMVG